MRLFFKSHRFIIAASFILIALLITGFIVGKEFKRASITNKAENMSTWYFDYMGRSFSDAGCFYTESGYLHFCDPSSGLDVLICDKAECQHNKEDCSAYFDGLHTYAAIDGNELLVLSDYGKTKYGEIGLYKTSLNGENRREIAVFDKIQEITGIIVSEEWIFLAYYNQYDENMEPMEANTAGLLAYNRNTGEKKYIWNDTNVNAMINSMAYHGEKIYFSYIYYDIGQEDIVEHAQDSTYIEDHLRYEFLMVSLDGETEYICDTIEEMSASFCGNEIFYNQNGKLYAYNTDDGIHNQIADSMYQIPTFSEGIMVFRKSEKEENNAYLYNSEKGIVEMLEGDLNDIFPIVVFPTYTYAWDYSGGNGMLGYLKTKEFLQGEFSQFHSFEKTEER